MTSFPYILFDCLPDPGQLGVGHIPAMRKIGLDYEKPSNQVNWSFLSSDFQSLFFVVGFKLKGLYLATRSQMTPPPPAFPKVSLNHHPSFASHQWCQYQWHMKWWWHHRRTHL
jgi:hypothetical protein